MKHSVTKSELLARLLSNFTAHSRGPHALKEVSDYRAGKIKQILG